MISQFVFALCADSVCLRLVFCHRPGADVQILFPEAQSESHQLLSGRSVCGSDRLADHRSGSGDLWVLPFIQVSLNTVSFALLKENLTLLFIVLNSFDCFGLIYFLQQRILPSGSRLHQTGACVGVFAQLTRDQHSKQFMTINT